MLTAVTPNSNKPFVFKSFQDAAKPKGVLSNIYSKRHKVSDAPDTSTKVKIAAGAVLGTVIPLMLFAKKQNLDLKKVSSLFKVEYGLKEMVGVSAGSIVGGGLAGITFDKKNTFKEKMDECTFQFLNSVIPPAMIAGMLEITETYGGKLKDNKLLKVGILLTGIFSGMKLAVRAANLINDPKDKVPDRKLSMLDAVVNVDDAVGALVLANFPCVKNLHIDKLLPIIYAWCGYRAGETN